MSINLSFREEGEGYHEAKRVADAMGMTVEAYLMACIEEGHQVLRARYHPTKADLEIPAYMRRAKNSVRLS